MSPTVTVVVLSYNRPEMLKESLASVVAQTHRPHEVIVVDNRSPRSGEVAAVVGGFPGVRLIANPTNLGFTGGMNAGLRAATGEYVVLSEDDIVLSLDAVEAIVGWLAVTPNAGIAGGLMLNKETGSVHCAGGRIRLGSRFEMDVIGAGAADDGRFREAFPVTYIPGAFMVARREVWVRLGGFRNRYYLYMEDVDLCLRAVAGGVRLHIVPAARIWHFSPPPGLRPPGWLRRLKYRNLLRLYLLNASVRVLPTFLVRYCVWAPMRELAQGRAGSLDALAAVVQTFIEFPSLLWDRRATARAVQDSNSPAQLGGAGSVSHHHCPGPSNDRGPIVS
jgi:GT2 family glycosyltransferase